jgi:very-short-patch-repair endonuclease
VLHARHGRHGVGKLRAILDEHFGEVAVTDSGFERLFLVRLAEVGLPRPVLQHEVVVGGRTYRLDLAYPEPMVDIELDGSIHREDEVWQKDLPRQNALMLAGWTVLRYTWRRYQCDWPGILREIRAAL